VERASSGVASPVSPRAACCSCDPYATCVEKVNHGGGGPGDPEGGHLESVDPGLIRVLLAILGMP